MGATAKVIEIWGDKSKQIESAEHIIKFPGGSISVMRTTDNKYWAHIEVYSPNKGKAYMDEGVRQRLNGFISEIRVDTPDGVKQVYCPDSDHIAVLISTSSNDLQKPEPNEKQLKLFV